MQRTLAWTIVLALAAAALAASGFTSRDPDSTVYAGIAARLASLPLHDWIAPQWWGLWKAEGPFREHPIGIFIPSALLGRTGYPAATAAYAMGAVYSALVVVMVRRLARLVLEPHEADALQWATMILPVAFVYRIRANHEYAVLLLLLVCVYAIDRSRRHLAWAGVAAAAAIGVLLVKGIFAIFAPIAAALWVLCVPPSSERDHKAHGYLAIVMMVVALGAATIGYELLYRAATGDSFLAYYLPERLGRNAGVGQARMNPATYVYNVSFYAARAIWYGAPGSLVLIALPFLGGLRGGSRAAGAARFAAAIALAYVIVMSLGHNKADRFVFPANFAVGIAGAAAAIRRWPVADRAARRISAWEPYGTPILWLVLFAITFATGHRLPRPKFWDG